MKLKPYPKYKDSGIKWIGEIPEVWEVHRLKSFIPYIINGQWGEEPNSDGFNMIVLRVADFGEFNFNLAKELTVRSVKNPKLRIREGDLVIEKSGGGEKQLVGRVIQLKNTNKKEKYTYSNFLGKFIIKKVISKNYLKYYFNAFYNSRVNYNYIKQTTGIQNIDTELLIQKEFFALPQDKHKQTAIANFLDKKTAKIDALIEKDEKLTELLKEKRAALIKHTVTKGLDPNAKLKNSGIDWIGKIPKGWEVRKLKYIGAITMGQSPNSDLVNGEGVSIPFFQGKADFGKLHPEPKSWIKYPIKIAQKKDILITVRAPVGALNIANQTCCIGRGIAAIKFQNYKYIYYVLHLVEKPLNIISSGSTFEAIGFNDLKTIDIPFCTNKQDQIAIANFLDKATTKIDKTIQRIEEKIKLLEAYKKSLIHHVVTGKVDVREVEV